MVISGGNEPGNYSKEENHKIQDKIKREHNRYASAGNKEITTSLPSS